MLSLGFLGASETSIAAPKDHRDIRKVKTMLSGTPLVLGLRTRMYMSRGSSCALVSVSTVFLGE